MKKALAHFLIAHFLALSSILFLSQKTVGF